MLGVRGTIFNIQYELIARAAGIYDRAHINVMLPPPSPPPTIGSGDTERTIRVHSLGALHSVSGLAIWFVGSGQFNERCGNPSLWTGISLFAFTHLN